jgi:hypothetical protein
MLTRWKELTHGGGGSVQMKNRCWQAPGMHAPQSQSRSLAQARRSQWCGDGEVALQSLLGGQATPPPTHDTDEQPCGSTSAPAPQT